MPFCPGRTDVLNFAATILLSAFLLFQVQPIVGRYLLPWFGGTSGVWAVCLVFFQVWLLAGYAYAHLLRTRLGASQFKVHAAVVLLSLAFLPLGPSMPGWLNDAPPELSIVVVLILSVGGPYFLLASTGPLLQSWFAAEHPTRPVYRLYALSNAGSLGALVSYPFLVEPYLSRRAQGYAWSAGYVVYAACLLAILWRLRAASWATPAPAGEEHRAAPSYSGADAVKWVALAAGGSAILVATSAQLSQEVAAIPLLWVVPLAIYLVTFIVAFDRPALYHRGLFAPLLLVSVVATAYVLGKGLHLSVVYQFGVYSAFLFLGAMVCHGELVRLRPGARGLTAFYLYVSLGGVLGGTAVAFVAPLAMEGLWDLHVCVVAALVAFPMLWTRELWQQGRRRVAVVLVGCSACVAVYTGVALLEDYEHSDGFIMHRSRTFYGALVVDQEDVGSHEQRRLRHGRTEHGMQFVANDNRVEPTTYYLRSSGVGLAIEHVRRSRSAAGAKPRFGVVGLGVGTLAAYSRPGEVWTYYEINPDVERIAREYFFYLEDAKGDVSVRHGDARLVLEREVMAAAPGKYDLLAVDAFSSDAVPTHLLTREAFQAYWGRLRPDGILAVHISNRYVDLMPVVLGAARVAGATVLRVRDDGDAPGGQGSKWVLLSLERRSLVDERGFIGGAPGDVREVKSNEPSLLWTDDYASMLELISWRETL